MKRALSKRRKKSKSGRPHVKGPRKAESLPVGWMLTVLTTLACELGALAAAWYVYVWPRAAAAQLLSDVLLFAAFVIGVVSLMLTAIVVKARSPVPPSGITVFALVVGAAPIATILLRLL